MKVRCKHFSLFSAARETEKQQEDVRYVHESQMSQMWQEYLIPILQWKLASWLEQQMCCSTAAVRDLKQSVLINSTQDFLAFRQISMKIASCFYVNVSVTFCGSR